MAYERTAGDSNSTKFSPLEMSENTRTLIFLNQLTMARTVRSSSKHGLSKKNIGQMGTLTEGSQACKSCHHGSQALACVAARKRFVWPHESSADYLVCLGILI